MSHIPRNAIVVGVGAEGAESALRFALTEARRTSRPVHLAHVLQLPPGEAYAGVYGGALDSAKATMAAALDRAHELAGSEVPVTGEVIKDGWLVDDLVRGTSGDQLLVLQHRALGRVHRVFAGSVVQSVAGRAHVPVVSVPEGWTEHVDQYAAVTAAVQDPVEATALLRKAFEEARARRASLAVLHAWWLSAGFNVVVDHDVRAEWAARSREELQPVIDPLRAAFADVEFTLLVRHAPPVEAVLDAAETSDLLVLGRRHHLLPLGSHLGPVARAALAHATCPVLITPELSTVAVADAEPRTLAHRPQPATADT
jgi:nucleotide-binding universal stress UspA family protein